MIKDLFKEIKHSILHNWFFKIRYVALLFIPFLYGFFYIYAFFNPFQYTDKLDMKVITQKNDSFGDAIGNVLSEKQVMQIGEMKMNLDLDHIYLDSDGDALDIANNSFATIEISTLDDKIVPFINLHFHEQSLNDFISTSESLVDLFTNANEPLVKIYTNFKKNYLIGFSTDIGVSMNGLINESIKLGVAGLANSNILEQTELTDLEKSEFNSFINEFKDIDIESFAPVELESYMGGDLAKYGFGLAPFFVSVALWIGTMSLTLAIHRRVHNKEVSPLRNYFTKYLLIISSVFIQATILMLGLLAIGFGDLGIGNWFSMYLFSILIGSLFASITQFIRYSVSSKNLGLFIIIIILVLQMASAGGLFPVETQNGFWRTIHVVLPMSHSVAIFRELAFEPDWLIVLGHFSILVVYGLLAFLGAVLFKRRHTKDGEVVYV